MLAKEAMDHGALGVTIFSSVSNAHRKATLFAPVICPLEIMPNGPHARSTRKRVGPYPIQEGADAQFRDGDMHVGIARVGHAP